MEKKSLQHADKTSRDSELHRFHAPNHRSSRFRNDHSLLQEKTVVVSGSPRAKPHASRIDFFGGRRAPVSMVRMENGERA